MTEKKLRKLYQHGGKAERNCGLPDPSEKYTESHGQLRLTRYSWRHILYPGMFAIPIRKHDVPAVM